jgi:hypothetical protein
VLAKAKRPDVGLGLTSIHISADRSEDPWNDPRFVALFAKMGEEAELSLAKDYGLSFPNQILQSPLGSIRMTVWF